MELPRPLQAPLSPNLQVFTSPEASEPCPLGQGSPTPGPRTSTGPWPVRNRGTQQEVSSRQATEASSVFTTALHCSHYHLSSASCQHYAELYNYFIILLLQCNSNRNKVHNKCYALESSRNHPPLPSPWKNCLPHGSLVPKGLRTAALGVLWRHHYTGVNDYLIGYW